MNQRLLEMISAQTVDEALRKEADALAARRGGVADLEVLKGLCGVLRKINIKKLQR